MQILWDRGESNVRDVTGRLDRPLAYTTVMTTLDRLFKKGLLARRKEDRAFVYSPKYSRGEWDQKRTGELIAACSRRTVQRASHFLPGRRRRPARCHLAR